ncbi:hypothetical protein [Streptomyces sp. KLOTTS4A1]|uniref:hypothetical protein n=1 Tax=Streptomyces sp. KLOTTS4A1 TaxID=3390996 RepID=UPI0039F4D928
MTANRPARHGTATHRLAALTESALGPMSVDQILAVRPDSGRPDSGRPDSGRPGGSPRTPRHWYAGLERTAA